MNFRSELHRYLAVKPDPIPNRLYGLRKNGWTERHGFSGAAISAPIMALAPEVHFLMHPCSGKYLAVTVPQRLKPYCAWNISGTAERAAEKVGELKLFRIFLYHQGGCPISHRVFAGRCGKFRYFLSVTAGIRSNPRGMNRQHPCLSHISPQKRGEIPGFPLRGTIQRRGVRLSIRKAAWNLPALPGLTGNPGVWGTRLGGRGKTVKSFALRGYSASCSAVPFHQRILPQLVKPLTSSSSDSGAAVPLFRISAQKAEAVSGPSLNRTEK
jgi:hypothetical protein